jgi:AcrR family transcriptional regulator
MVSLSEEGVRPRRRGRGRDLEAELLRAGREVFARQGYDKVRVEDLLAEACVSRHSFYRFFESKHDVLMRLTEGVTQELIEGIAEVVARSDDPAVKVRSAVEVYFRWMQDLGPFWRVLESQQAVPGSAAEAVRQRALTGIRELLQGEARPIIGDLADDDFLVSALVAAIEGMGRQMLERPGGPGQVERLTQIALVILWRSLAPPGTPDPTRSAE